MERNDTRDTVETIKGDTNDALHEAKERVEAGGEKMKRAVQGDSMPLGDRLASHVKEFGHNLSADADKSKRDLRDGEA
ncbi:MAG TPA: hypothetical protein VGD01_19100 [Candidatus Elarobacter sp.]|jgi:hypothetical protein